MNKVITTIAVTVLLTTGCTSVPMESKEKSELAKQYNSPSEGKAGLYVYRSGSFGGALKKDVWLNGKCVGETAPNMFFYDEIEGNTEHKISTESEFSPNDLLVKTESGKNYFVSQYMKMGVFVGGAGVELVDEEKGKKQVSKLDMAIKGKCSS
jgi:alpha-mannosidase